MANGLIDYNFNPRTPSLRNRPSGAITAQGRLPVGYNIPRNLPQLRIGILPSLSSQAMTDQPTLAMPNLPEMPTVPEMPSPESTSQQEQNPTLGQRARGILGSIGGFLSNPDVLDNLAIGLSGLSMNPNQALMQQAAGRIQRRQQLSAMQGYANRTAEYFRSIGRDDLADQVLRFPESSQQFLSSYLEDQRSSGAAGLDKLLSTIDPDLYELESLNEFSAKYAQTGEADYSLLQPRDKDIEIKQGYQPVYGDNGRYLGQIPMPGPEWREAQNNIDKAFNAVENTRDTGFDVIRNIDDALSQLQNNPNALTGFWGAQLKTIGGTPQYDLDQTLDSIKAALGFGELQAMREASTTGGALGNVVVREIELLQRVIDSLEQAQTPEKLEESLNNIKNNYLNIMRKLPPRRLTQREYFGIDTPDFLNDDYETMSAQEFYDLYFGPNSQFSRYGAQQAGQTFGNNIPPVIQTPAPNQVPAIQPQSGLDPLNLFGI